MRLFICYAHVDKATVKDWIVDRLRAGGHDVWFDDQLVAGQDWAQQLSEQIQRCDAFVYAMSPESVTDEWCQWEFAHAIDLGKPIIPVLLQTNTRLPDNLQRIRYVDFSDGPTGDAVARLMGGLQNLSPLVIPALPTDPQPALRLGELRQEAAEPARNVKQFKVVLRYKGEVRSVHT